MEKRSFMYLVLAVVGGLLFALGMCMCLLPEWNAFAPGAVVTALGVLVLLAIALVRWIAAGKPVARVNWRLVGKVAYGVVSTLVFGTGMCLTMAFEGLMIPGILVGVVGIVLLLGLIPVFRGLK